MTRQELIAGLRAEAEAAYAATQALDEQLTAYRREIDRLVRERERAGQRYSDLTNGADGLERLEAAS
jgi:hypothetical protein